MKMTKLLAGFAAAALAVTSLATVASAEEVTKEFDMGSTIASYASNVDLVREINKTIGRSATQTNMQLVEFDLGANWTSFTGIDGGMWESVATWNGDITLRVKGLKYSVDEKGNTTTKEITKEYKVFYDNAGAKNNGTITANAYNHNTAESGKAYIVVLKDDEEVNGAYEFAPYYYDEITDLELGFPVYGNTSSEGVYKHYVSVNEAYDIGNVNVYNWAPVSDLTKLSSANKSYYKDTADLDKDKNTAEPGTCIYADATLRGTAVATYGESITGNKATLATAQAAGNAAAGLIAYAFTNGGYAPSIGAFVDATVTRNFTFASGNYPLMKYTDLNDDGTIKRSEVWLLSETGDQASTGNNGNDGDQSYGADFTKGTNPNGFAGMASQVGEFFNKQNNGTITFKFTTKTSSTSTSWTTGGMPSTEVGLKQAIDGSKVTDFALFFNWSNTSGTMLTAVKVDKDSGEVVFDITDYLDTCGGLTQATLENIFYGLSTAIDYGSGDYGLKVETVTLSYDDAATEDPADEDDTDTTDEDDTDDTDDVTDPVIDDDEDDTDPVIDDDEDDTTVPADDVDGDTDVTPADDDDTNPPTGVALAVIPAMIAGAAAIVAKKRK